LTTRPLVTSRQGMTRAVRTPATVPATRPSAPTGCGGWAGRSAERAQLLPGQPTRRPGAHGTGQGRNRRPDDEGSGPTRRLGLVAGLAEPGEGPLALRIHGPVHHDVAPQRRARTAITL